MNTDSASNVDRKIALNQWRIMQTQANEFSSPLELSHAQLTGLSSESSITVAEVLQKHQQLALSDHPQLDQFDWWYHCEFSTDTFAINQLCFDGLATLAEVWLNDTLILESDNMFLQHNLDVSQQLSEQNHLYICFRSLTSKLSEKRARPRWKTNLITQQQLRWIRTTLLGRMPGWTPAIDPIGPWRPATLQQAEHFLPYDLTVKSLLAEDLGSGQLDIAFKIKSEIDVSKFQFHLELDGNEIPIEIVAPSRQTPQASGSPFEFLLIAQVDKPPLWWPHTHGKPNLLTCSLAIKTPNKTTTISCGEIGFRHVKADRHNGNFAIEVNGQAVFCRGSCWAINDIISLDGSPEHTEQLLKLAQSAGMNMIRVGGTMVYPNQHFYETCDRLGIMVWQDFMFANMDYPVEDEVFQASITKEATQLLNQLSAHPCVSVYCGGSEVEQQSAMLGMPKELWSNLWFSQQLPQLCEAIHPNTLYVSSSPTGGALPFHISTGIAHYYGVGAYLQPINSLRKDRVRFASECLGFANIPEPSTVDEMMSGKLPVAHHPDWKRRVPRDNGAGWDFEDVRDFYLQELFNVEPVALRSFDSERYFELSRVTSGEVMQQVISEWRSCHNPCNGALTWFYNDFWPASGWGMVDHKGQPKAAYYQIKQVMQPIQVLLTNEGLEGFHIHLINETELPFKGSISLKLLQHGHILIADKSQTCEIPARSQQHIEADALLEIFYDVAYAFRFGPPKHQQVCVELRDTDGNVVSEHVALVQKETPQRQTIQVDIQSEQLDDGRVIMNLCAAGFVQYARFDIKGYLPSNNYFHLIPGSPKQITFTPVVDAKKTSFKGYLEAVNLSEPIKFKGKKT